MFLTEKQEITVRRARASRDCGQKSAAALRIKLEEPEERGRDGCPGYAKLHSGCPQVFKLKMIATKQTKATYAVLQSLVRRGGESSHAMTGTVTGCGRNLRKTNARRLKSPGTITR